MCLHRARATIVDRKPQRKAETQVYTPFQLSCSWSPQAGVAEQNKQHSVDNFLKLLPRTVSTKNYHWMEVPLTQFFFHIHVCQRLKTIRQCSVTLWSTRFESGPQLFGIQIFTQKNRHSLHSLITWPQLGVSQRSSWADLWLIPFDHLTRLLKVLNCQLLL